MLAILAGIAVLPAGQPVGLARSIKGLKTENLSTNSVGKSGENTGMKIGRPHAVRLCDRLSLFRACHQSSDPCAGAVKSPAVGAVRSPG